MTAAADFLPTPDLADELSESASLYAMVMRGVRRLRPKSPLERALLTHVKLAARSVGNQILAARDLADLEKRLDDAILSDAFARYNEDASVVLNSRAIREIRTRVGSRLEPTDDVVNVLGRQHARRLHQAAPVVIAHTSALLQLVARLPPEGSGASETWNLRGHLTDAAVPPGLRRANHAMTCGFAAMLAIIAATLPAKSARLEPWLAKALVESYVTGVYVHLQLIGGIDGIVIDHSVLPVAERMNIALVDRRWRERWSRVLAHLDGATAGQPIVGSPFID